jgi:hypothetical protein
VRCSEGEAQRSLEAAAESRQVDDVAKRCKRAQRAHSSSQQQYAAVEVTLSDTRHSPQKRKRE